MKHKYVPVMAEGKEVGFSYIDAGRLLVQITDQRMKKLMWDDHLLTNVSIDLPGNNNLTITPMKEGNENG